MINLLPPAEKQNLSLEDRWRTVLILGLVMLIFFASLILIFILINFSLGSQVKSQDVILENEENRFASEGIQTVKNDVEQANRNLLAIDSFYKQKADMTGFLEKISSLLPKGIYLNSISINPCSGGENAFQVSIAGHALAIENVIELNEKLKGDDQFSNVSFPSDTWFKKQDFIFAVTFQTNILNDTQE